MLIHTLVVCTLVFFLKINLTGMIDIPISLHDLSFRLIPHQAFVEDGTKSCRSAPNGWQVVFEPE